MHVFALLTALVLCPMTMIPPLAAQAPFYTDDPAVIETDKLHFEFFNEYDALQLQYPNLRQNTANYKVQYGLPFSLELDVDTPLLAIYRAVGTSDSTGGGDTEVGVKWEFHKERPGSRVPAFAASFYVEVPTGDSKQQLGSGLTDYWLNLSIQKSLSDKSRVNWNIGYLFAGNTVTGVVGISSNRGHVITGGLSLLHDFTPRLTLGVEVYGGYTENGDLGKSQLQALGGGEYQLRNGFALTFAILGGKYVASPRIGGQVGFTMDFPDLWRRPAHN